VMEQMRVFLEQSKIECKLLLFKDIFLLLFIYFILFLMFYEI
jgi:hypothetical protein